MRRMDFQSMKPRLVPAQVPNRLLGVAWALVIAFLFVLAVDSFISNCGGDACLFIYVAEGILQGEAPYLDRWDNKGPLLYLLHAIGLMTNEEWGIWAIQGLFLLGTVWFAFALLRKLFGLLPALFALAVFLAYLSRFARQETIPSNSAFSSSFSPSISSFAAKKTPNPCPPNFNSLCCTSASAPSVLLPSCLGRTSSPFGSS